MTGLLSCAGSLVPVQSLPLLLPLTAGDKAGRKEKAGAVSSCADVGVDVGEAVFRSLTEVQDDTGKV